jgi:hypothetical protein
MDYADFISHTIDCFRQVGVEKTSASSFIFPGSGGVKRIVSFKKYAEEVEALMPESWYAQKPPVPASKIHSFMALALDQMKTEKEEVSCDWVWFMDCKDHTNYRMYLPEVGEIVQGQDLETFKRNEGKQVMVTADLVYDPRIPPVTFLDLNCVTRETKVNLYQAPKWTTLKYSGRKPEVLIGFFNHLFPMPEDRVWVRRWLKRLINPSEGRNLVALALVGLQGTGKTIFASGLCGALVGKFNALNESGNSLSSNFNSHLRNLRLVNIDDGTVAKDGNANLKNLFNNEGTSEGKGANRVKTDWHFSTILCNNNARDIHLEANDRRFMIPELPKTRLPEVMAQRVLKVIEDDQIIRDFCEWVNEAEEVNLALPPKTVAYYRVAMASLSDFYRDLVLTVASEGAYTTQHQLIYVKENHAPKYHISTINNFCLNSFLGPNGGPLLKLETTERPNRSVSKTIFKITPIDSEAKKFLQQVAGIYRESINTVEDDPLGSL